jgi:hypothetical protein
MMMPRVRRAPWRKYSGDIFLDSLEFLQANVPFHQRAPCPAIKTEHPTQSSYRCNALLLASGEIGAISGAQWRAGFQIDYLFKALYS